MTPAPWIGLVGVPAVLGGALVLLRVWQRRAGAPAELTRKGLHVLMGGVSLLLPLLFDAVWPVALLALVSATAMAALRWVPALRRRLGGVLHGVGRESYGELCFPVAVLVLYVGSGGGGPGYVIPLLLLALADAAAALVGARLGTVRFATLDGTKSLAGSATFFAVALPCIALPLLGAGLAPAVAVPAALLVGLGATLVEAASWRGLDNLLVPVYGLVALHPILGAAPHVPLLASM